MTTHAEAGLRERKKHQTRQRIHHAAVQLAAQRGLDAVTVDEIAAEADVSTRTFFNYFPGKDQAIVGIDPEAVENFAAAIREAPAELEPLECLERAALCILENKVSTPDIKGLRMRVIEENPRLLPAMFGAGRQLDQAAAEALAQRLGMQTDDLYPQLLVATATVAVRTSLHQQAHRDMDVAEALHEAFGVLRSGFALPAGSIAWAGRQVPECQVLSAGLPD